MYIYINNEYLPEKGRPRCYVKPSTVQDVFGLISCAGMAGRPEDGDAKCITCSQ